MKPLPIVRHADVPAGFVYVFPRGTHAWNILDGTNLSLKAGIYVGTSETRSDDEIRRVAHDPR